jgi:hypothetical protein
MGIVALQRDGKVRLRKVGAQAPAVWRERSDTQQSVPLAGGTDIVLEEPDEVGPEIHGRSFGSEGYANGRKDGGASPEGLGRMEFKDDHGDLLPVLPKVPQIQRLAHHFIPPELEKFSSQPNIDFGCAITRAKL